MKKGDTVIAAIRPHNIEVQEATTRKGGNILPCRVEASAYFGDRMEYRMSIGTQTVVASSSLSLRLAPGDIGALDLNAEAVMLWQEHDSPVQSG
jgi:hypothetical protein